MGGAAPPSSAADQTGSYLGAAPVPRRAISAYRTSFPIRSTTRLLIQATPHEYEQIMGLARQLDIPPRQVLIDAKIYEVDLNGAFAAGVTAYLQKEAQRGTFSRTADTRLLGRGRNRL